MSGSKNCNNRKVLKVALLFAAVVLCLITNALGGHSGPSNLLSTIAVLFSRSDTQWLFYIYILVWCVCFVLLLFSTEDILLIGLLLVGGFFYAVKYPTAFRSMEALVFLCGITLGKAAKFVFKPRAEAQGLKAESPNSRRQKGECKKMQGMKIANGELRMFLFGLAVLLAFASWWHLKVMHNFYPGTRWTGLWDNPNTYGMLMGTGAVLAIGLLAQMWNAECGMWNEKKRNAKSVMQSVICDWKSAILLVAAGMMVVGLFFSYSRGAWLGTAIGLLYLAKAHGKFKWRFVLLGIVAVAAVVFVFWHSTSDSGPWFLKRMDLSRASAQHRVSAWRGAVQMMWDHPFGVGWNNAVQTYEKNYSPPEGGTAAITTNDYLMLGTQLGFPGLIFFVAYVGLCFRKCGVRSLEFINSELRTPNSEFRIKTACRAGALVMLVAFWFDGGLFKLATAAVFWILLELSQVRGAE